MTDRIVDTEQQYLGGLLLMATRQEDLRDIEKQVSGLSADDFYIRWHIQMFDCIQRRVFAGQSFDWQMVVSHVDKLQNDGSSSFQYILDLVKNTASTASIKERKNAIRNASTKRKGLTLTNQIAELLSTREDAVQALGEAESLISELLGKSVTDETRFKHAKEVFTEYLDELEHDVLNPNDTAGISTGFSGIDDLLGKKKLRPGSLAVIAGAPGMGKTGFMVSLLGHVGQTYNEKRNLIYSLEMPNSQLMERMISQSTGYSYERAFDEISRDGGDMFFAKASRMASDVTNSSLYMCDKPGLSLEQIKSDARKESLKGDIGIMAIDYLTLMDMPNEERRDLSVGKVTRELKKLAQELGCVIVLLCQLNRNLSTRKDKRPIIQDLRDSGQIEQDAAYIIMLYRDKEYDPESPAGDVGEAILRKNRFGQTGTAACLVQNGAWLDMKQDEGMAAINQSNDKLNGAGQFAQQPKDYLKHKPM